MQARMAKKQFKYMSGANVLIWDEVVQGPNRNYEPAALFYSQTTYWEPPFINAKTCQLNNFINFFLFFSFFFFVVASLMVTRYPSCTSGIVNWTRWHSLTLLQEGEIKRTMLQLTRMIWMMLKGTATSLVEDRVTKWWRHKKHFFFAFQRFEYHLSVEHDEKPPQSKFGGNQFLGARDMATWILIISPIEINVNWPGS